MHKVLVNLMSLQDWERGVRQNICTLKKVMCSDVLLHHRFDSDDIYDAFVMLGVLLRKLVAAERGQDLSAVGDLVWSVLLVWAVNSLLVVSVLNISFGSGCSLVWTVG